MTGFSSLGGLSGPAGPDGTGDLTGSYPSPIVKGLQTQPIDPRTPIDGDALIYHAGEWVPTPSPTNIAYFKGTWNADTNTPDIKNYPGLSDGYAWIVTVAGNYAGLDAITSWSVGDYALYSNGEWYKLSSKTFGWGLTGNAGTVAGIDYAGTSDAVDFVLKTNGNEVMRLYSGGGSILNGSSVVMGDLIVSGGHALKITRGGNGHYSSFSVNSSQTSNIDYTLPVTLGASGSFLTVGGSGQMSWNSPVSISAGTGLTGGGTTAANLSLSLSNTGSAGTYGSSTQSPVITTDGQGRVTSVSPVTISGVSPGGLASGDLSGSYPSPTVVALQARPVPDIAPSSGQVLTWNGGDWRPASAPRGGSGGGGILYYLNQNTAAQSPTTGLTSPTVRQLGVSADVSQTSTTLNNVPTGGSYGSVAGFVTDVNVPGLNTIPAGIWDLNVWLTSSTSLSDVLSVRISVYKYDGVSPSLISRSDDAFVYNPQNTTQYVLSVALAQTALLSTDRIFVELEATSTKTGVSVTAYFGNATSSHVHTTLPSVAGSGIVHVINGVLQSPATPVYLNSSDTSGILPISKGGTGLGTTPTSGQLLIGNGVGFTESTLTQGTGIRVTNGAGSIGLSINDSVVATVSGTTFTGAVKFNAGLSGSLTTLTDGTSYILAGQNMSVTTGSSGAITAAFKTSISPSVNDLLSYNGTEWSPTSSANALQASFQTVYATENIAAGDVCYIVNSGGSGTAPGVARAQANSLTTAKGVIGLATAAIAKNTFGIVQTYGQLIGPVDTHTFSQGAPLYVSTSTPGGVTDTKPAGPNYAFQIGLVTRQGQPANVTQGIVFISPMMQTDTKNISDIVSTSPADHDGFMYDPVSSTWKNAQPLWIPETQTALTLAAGSTIAAADFLNVVYLPIKTAGGANITLSATTPIVSLTKTAADYGRELWLHNVDNNRNITIPSGANVKLDGGVNLTLTPGTVVKFLWTGLGGNGSWIQTGKTITVS